MKYEDVVGAAPTGDAPTTSEWSTILFHTKVRLILEVLLRYGCSQWETTLQCNIISHWSSPCPEWSLLCDCCIRVCGIEDCQTASILSMSTKEATLSSFSFKDLFNKSMVSIQCDAANIPVVTYSFPVFHIISRLILGLRPTNERWRYISHWLDESLESSNYDVYN